MRARMVSWRAISSVLIGSAAAFLAQPASANEFVRPTGHIVLYAPTDRQSGGDVLTVARGEEFGINCGCFSGSNADVRVVLALSPDAGDTPTGYKKLLATDEQIDDHGGLLVRVPDAPGLANHTVSVKVYVVDANGARACDAGKVRIT